MQSIIGCITKRLGWSENGAKTPGHGTLFIGKITLKPNGRLGMAKTFMADHVGYWLG